MCLSCNLPHQSLEPQSTPHVLLCLSIRHFCVVPSFSGCLHLILFSYCFSVLGVFLFFFFFFFLLLSLDFYFFSFILFNFQVFPSKVQATFNCCKIKKKIHEHTKRRYKHIPNLSYCTKMKPKYSKYKPCHHVHVHPSENEDIKYSFVGPGFQLNLRAYEHIFITVTSGLRERKLVEVVTKVVDQT